MKKYFYILLIIVFYSCKSEDAPSFSIDLHNGIFITNEGPFQNGVGTITFISDSGEVTQNVYQKVNHEDLGNIVQSMTLHQDRAFIVVNNSHKVVVADRYSLKKIAVIEGDFIENPRYFKAIGNYGYISNWGNPQETNDDFIAVINLTDYSLISKISVPEGPEKMLLHNNKLYVALQGGFGFNNKVVIINTNNNTVENTLLVGDVPVGIEKDNNGFIWVLCQGIPNYAQEPETPGKLVKIYNNQVDTEFNFIQATKHPKNSTIDSGFLYFTMADKVYQFDITSTNLPETPLPSLSGNYYTIEAKNSKLYLTDALNYSSEGKLKIYDLQTNSIINEYATGIIPGGIIFTE